MEVQEEAVSIWKCWPVSKLFGSVGLVRRI